MKMPRYSACAIGLMGNDYSYLTYEELTIISIARYQLALSYEAKLTCPNAIDHASYIIRDCLFFTGDIV